MPLDSNLKDAVTRLQDLARDLHAVMTVADAIKNVAALEQLANEAENRKKAADASIDTAKGTLTGVEEAVRKATGDVEAAVRKADKILMDARQEAERIKAAANTEAQKITASAHVKAEEARAEADGHVKAAKAELATVEDSIATAREQLARVQADTRGEQKKAAEARKYLEGLAAR